MANSFSIPEKAYDGFLDLIDMGSQKLEQLTYELPGRELTLDLPELAKQLAKVIDFPLERVERVLHAVLIPLNSLRAAFRMSPKDFLHLLEELIGARKRIGTRSMANGGGRLPRKSSR